MGMLQQSHVGGRGWKQIFNHSCWLGFGCSLAWGSSWLTRRLLQELLGECFHYVLVGFQSKGLESLECFCLPTSNKINLVQRLPKAENLTESGQLELFCTFSQASFSMPSTCVALSDKVPLIFWKSEANRILLKPSIVFLEVSMQVSMATLMYGCVVSSFLKSNHASKCMSSSPRRRLGPNFEPARRLESKPSIAKEKCPFTCSWVTIHWQHVKQGKGEAT